MRSSSSLLLFAARLAMAAVYPRQQPSGTPTSQNSSDGPWQNVPGTQPKKDNTYYNGQPKLNTEPAISTEMVAPEFAAHPIDIPFGRLHKGALKYFPAGQLNSPDGITDDWQPNVNDFANQSACGIPDNAFYISKVAIHPYFLKYSPDGLGLSRMILKSLNQNFANLVHRLLHARRLHLFYNPSMVTGYDPQSDRHMLHRH